MDLQKRGLATAREWSSGNLRRLMHDKATAPSRLAGVTSPYCGLGANTPVPDQIPEVGGGAARRAMQSSGSSTTCVVPLRNGVLNRYPVTGSRLSRNMLGFCSGRPKVRRIVIRGIQGQIVVLGIAFQPALPFQVTADPMRYLVRQLLQFATAGSIDPVETGACTLGVSEVGTVQEQHMKMNISCEVLRYLE